MISEYQYLQKKKSKLFKKNAIVKKKGHCYLRKDTLCIYL